MDRWSTNDLCSKKTVHERVVDRVRLAVVAICRDHGRRGEGVRQHRRAQQWRTLFCVAQLHHRQWLCTDRAAWRHQTVRLRHQLPAVARDHSVPGRLPRGRPVQPGKAVPEPDADPRIAQSAFPGTGANDPRQSWPQGDRTVQLDQHHTGFRDHFEKSQWVVPIL